MASNKRPAKKAKKAKIRRGNPPPASAPDMMSIGNVMRVLALLSELPPKTRTSLKQFW